MNIKWIDAEMAQKRVRDVERERDELRAANAVLQLRGDTYLEQLEQKHAEIERLRTQVEWWKTRAETYESLAERLTSAARTSGSGGGGVRRAAQST